jgi:hypothetical protein
MIKLVSLFYLGREKDSQTLSLITWVDLQYYKQPTLQQQNKKKRNILISHVDFKGEFLLSFLKTTQKLL